MTESPEPKPSKSDPTVAWNKVQLYLDRLFDSLQELDEGGGLVAASAKAGWKPGKMDKATGSLKAVRDAIDAELAKSKTARRGPGR